MQTSVEIPYRGHTNRTMKRHCAFKSFAVQKLSCIRQTRLQTFHSFVLFLLTYYCELLVVAEEKVLDIQKKIKYNFSCIVARAASTTTIDATLMLPGFESLKFLTEEKTLNL